MQFAEGDQNLTICYDWNKTKLCDKFKIVLLTEQIFESATQLIRNKFWRH